MRPLMLLSMLVLVSPARAAWPDYRGPNADGHAGDAGIPLTWSENQNVAWKTPIPGKGWSTPVILTDTLWMTTATEDGREMSAVAVNAADGRIKHHVKLFTPTELGRLNRLNSWASPSPTLDERRVYVYFGTHGVAALDAKTAKVLWRRSDLNLEHSQGPGSTPILYKDLLIFHCDGTDVQYVVALDRKTGKTVWRVKRAHDLEDVGSENRKSYATPIVIQVGGKDQLISQAAQCVFAYEPATGREIWRFRYKGYSNVPRPLVHDGLVIFSSGYDTAFLFAVRLGGRGDVTDTHGAWTFGPSSRIPRRSTPILVDGLLYMNSDSGIATCLDAKTGKPVWEKQRLGGAYSASPLYADGRIYFFSQQGHATVLKPGATFEVLAVNKLDDGFMASPVVHDGALFLRSKTHLYRIQAK